MDNFLDHYQIMRNLLHIDKDSYVIFIYPKNNKHIRQEALFARKNIINSGWESHFILFCWEDLVRELQSRITDEKLSAYYENDFSHKYLT